MRKRTNNDLQTFTQKIKDQTNRTPLNAGVDADDAEGLGISCSIRGSRRGSFITNPVISHE